MPGERHTGESPPRSFHTINTSSSVSTRSVVEALRKAEWAQAEAFTTGFGAAALNAHHGLEATRRLRLQIEAQSGLDTPFDRTLFAVPAVVPEWLPNSIARLFAKPFDAKRVVKDIAEERSRMPYAPVGTFSGFES